MKKVFGMLFVLVLAVSLVLVPAAVLAESPPSMASDCVYDTVKWQDNDLSYNMYILHWGKTPLNAMSRLAGLCHSPLNPYPELCPPTGSCNGGCCCTGSESIGCCAEDVACEACSTEGLCCCCWGTKKG